MLKEAAVKECGYARKAAKTSHVFIYILALKLEAWPKASADKIGGVIRIIIKEVFLYCLSIGLLRP